MLGKCIEFGKDKDKSKHKGKKILKGLIMVA